MSETAREVLGVLLVGLLVLSLAYCLTQPTAEEWDTERRRACFESGGQPVLRDGRFAECRSPRD